MASRAPAQSVAATVGEPLVSGAHRVDEHDRHLDAGELASRRRQQPRHDEDDAVGSSLDEVVEPVGSADRPAVGGRHDETDAEACRLALGAAQQAAAHWVSRLRITKSTRPVPRPARGRRW